MLAGYVLIYVVLSTTGLLLLRSSLQGSRSIGSLVSDPVFLIGGVCYACSFFAWLLSLRRYELTTIYPIVVGAGYSAIVVASFLFLGERPSSVKLIGIALVGVGVYFLV